MSYSAREYLDKAAECILMASTAEDRGAKVAFLEMARQWQEIARQKEAMEWDRPRQLRRPIYRS